MGLKKIQISDWKQFRNVEIEFHPKLTVLTGANGSGKTTILNILAQHFGWGIHELSTPAKDTQTGLMRFFTRFLFLKNIFQPQESAATIGKLEYDSGNSANLEIPNQDAASYQVNISGRQEVKGLYIPSHRPLFSYTAVSQLPIQKRSKSEAFSLVVNSLRQRVLGGGGHPTNYHIKETLLTWAVYGFGNNVIEADQEQIDNYNGFEDILRKVLPKQIGFERFAIRKNEVVLETKTGQFMIDAVSGGVSAIIDLAWQIYMASTKDGEKLTVLIDEAENHLHATMQRSILPDFLNAFPSIQFIVSTHNPLIVGSVKDSRVYVLQFGDDNRVFSSELDIVNKAKTASEILRDVLGVPFTMPVWVEEKLQEIVSKYSKGEINEETIGEMRNELSEVGLEELIPEATIKTLEKSDNDKN